MNRIDRIRKLIKVAAIIADDEADHYCANTLRKAAKALTKALSLLEDPIFDELEHCDDLKEDLQPTAK